MVAVNANTWAEQIVLLEREDRVTLDLLPVQQPFSLRLPLLFGVSL